MTEQTNTALMNQVFANELTQQGLAELQAKYKGMVLDMSVDADFKQGRKIRTERNKLTEAIKRRRIDVSNEIKGHADAITGAINEVYEPIVDAFEAEDQRRKEEAERIKREREEFLNAQRKEIAQMLQWVEEARDQTSDQIASLIDAVANIDTDCFDDELLREAIDTKKQAAEDLYRLMSDAKAREKLEEERAALAEKRRQEEQKANIDERINNLRMMPTNFFQKSSDEIRRQVAKLEKYTPTQEEFLDRADEAEQAKQQVIQQLSMMTDQKAMVEAAEREAEAKRQAESDQLEQKRVGVDMASGQDETVTKVVGDHEPQASETVTQEQPVDSQVTLMQSELNQMLQNSYAQGWDDGVKAGMPYAECMAMSQQ